MALKKMTIVAYDDDEFTSQSGSYSVLINPDEYSHKYKILYNKKKGQGAKAEEPTFNRMCGETVSFTIWFDGTGVVPDVTGTAGSTSIRDQIRDFRHLVFDYSGNIHSPRYLELSWGTLLFRCRLESLDLSYTMFSPDGMPIRAKAALSLIGYTNPKEAAKKAGDNSPDMSHLVQVKAGDTLPLLCYRIYGTSLPYAEVARVNGLTSFRRLEPGRQLLFPPLRTSST